MTDALATAVERKNAGNESYGVGNLSSAATEYDTAVRALTGGKGADLVAASLWALVERHAAPESLCAAAAALMDASYFTETGLVGSKEALKLMSILLSNRSQVLLDQHEVAAASRHAASAAACDAENAKAWLRFVKALHADKFHFAAFVVLHLRVKPLLERVMKPPERTAALAGVETSIADAAGIAGLSPHFAIVDHHGGIGSVASARIPSDHQLFVETRATCAAVAPDPKVILPSAAKQTVSHETVFLHFAGQLVDAVASAASWGAVARLLGGSWPRHPVEIAESVLTSARATFEANFPDFSRAHDEDTIVSVVHRALVCRYNCFHAGFFRACALLNHSCAPTAAMKVAARGTEVHLVAVKPVEAGEALTVKYLTDLEFLLGAGRRRELLHDSWLFYCDCPRCAEECRGPSAEGSGGHPAEMVLCCHEGCQNLVHLPMPGTSGSRGDPLIPASRRCSACGHERTWADADVKRLYGIVELATKPAEQHLTQLSAATVEFRHLAREHVGPEHWILRVLLFCYGSSLINVIAKFWSRTAQSQMSPPDCTIELLRHFGWGPRGERNGGDILVMMRELWRLIAGFYPPAQAWMLHVAICRLICFSIADPTHQASLPFDEAVALLQEHAAVLGMSERREMLRWLTTTPTAGSLGPKQMGTLKKVLSK